MTRYKGNDLNKYWICCGRTYPITEGQCSCCGRYFTQNDAMNGLNPAPATGLSAGPDADKGGSDSPTAPHGAAGSEDRK